jgi:uncharacterized RDD family membrane protein YckC
MWSSVVLTPSAPLRAGSSKIAKGGAASLPARLTMRARSLAPLAKTRGFGMTPRNEEGVVFNKVRHCRIHPRIDGVGGARLGCWPTTDAAFSMPTVNEFWNVAAQVATERGGLVVGFAKGSEQPELGAALDNVFGFAPQAPVTVMSPSDWADWVEQVEAFYRLRPDWGRGKRGAADANYYRVKFEEKFEGKFAGKFDEFDASANSAAGTGFGASSPFSTAFDIPSFGTPSFAGYAAPLSGLRGVTFWPRLLARVIDFVVHRLAALLAGSLFILMLKMAAGGRPPAWVIYRLTEIHFSGLVAGVLGLFAYNVICTSVHGSTLGKLVLGMQVIQDDGSPCRPKSAILRELGYFVDAMFFGVIGYFAMQEDPEQKRHGDEWADTIVCRRAQVPSSSKRSGMQFGLGLLLGMAADMALLMTGWLIQMNT